MSIKIIEKRLKAYNPESARDELNALKEITQEIALYALAKANFFNQAAFQGGTCLRIVHELNRFSEDLDFILFKPDQTFLWEPFLKALKLEFKRFKLEFDVLDRSQADRAVKQAFLKDSSFGKVFVFFHPRGPDDQQTMKIKLEIDTNPPGGSEFERQSLAFPSTFSIVSQDLPSLFAGKCHALLCRSYTKGRDWYDFVWYVSNKVVPNFTHLTQAIHQNGPWGKQNITITKNWLLEALSKKAEITDWAVAKNDASRFLRAKERDDLNVWDKEFFLAMIKKFSKNLSSH